jgi:hypothetical protein
MAAASERDQTLPVPEIQVESRPEPSQTTQFEPDIPLSDFSNHLVPQTGIEQHEQEPEWDRGSLPFRLPILSPSTSNEQPSTWSLKLGAIRRFPHRLGNPPPPPSIPLRRRFTGECRLRLCFWRDE